MKQIVEVYFVDGTPPFKFETLEVSSKQTASKIFREGFIANHDDNSTTYHSPNNIKKVVVKPA